MDTLPLDFLGAGEWAEIVDVGGNPAWVARLAELGFRTGDSLQMIRPGSPCIVFVSGARLSLRGDETACIFVRPVATPTRVPQ